jgi:hypothetical protein
MLASVSPSYAAPSASASAAYARREPENTVLHRIVREHLATFLATVREERGKSLPRYVEEELRRYLRYGIPAYGFLRVVCSNSCFAILDGSQLDSFAGEVVIPRSRRFGRAPPDAARRPAQG